MYKLVCYKEYFTSGRGADRATAMLLNELAQRGYDIHFITHHDH